MPPNLEQVPASYYENFLESLAQILSRLLTDKETESVLSSIRSFQERLKRLSSQNLSRLRLELAVAEEKKHILCRHEGKTCTQNCTRGFFKAFAVTFSVKYLIGILPAVLTGRVLKRPQILRQMAGRDTAGFALFLSVFLSSYKGILCTLRHLRNKGGSPVSDRLNAFVAGTVAGLALIIDRDKRRRQVIMLYLMTRSLQFSGAWLMKRWAHHRRVRRQRELARLKEEVDRADDGRLLALNVAKRWDDYLAQGLQQWAGVLVMALANMQIIYAFLFHSDTLPKSYYSFLLSHANWKSDFGNLVYPMSNAIRDTIEHYSVEPSSTSIRLPPGISSRDFVAQNISPNIATLLPHGVRHPFIVCALQHPHNPSCAQNNLNLFRAEYLRALKLYVPLNVIMTIIFRSGQLRTNPSTVMQKFFWTCMRSALFLSMYATMGFSTPCAMRRLVNKERLWVYVLTGAVAGTAALIEAPARRLELGLYCLPRAIESWWQIMVKRGVVRNVPLGDVWLFMLSMGTLMTLYQNEKDTISPHYLSVMTRFFGTN